MSRKGRKIAYNFVDLIDKDNDERSMDPSLLVKVLQEASSYPIEVRSQNVRSSNRWHSLHSLKANSDGTYSLLFKSCKYHHKPPLINHLTGDERDNPKELEEGESEATHILMATRDDRLVFLSEERQTGIGFITFVNFLRELSKEVYSSKHENVPFKLVSGNFGSHDFLRDLRDAGRVKLAKVIADVPLGNSDVAKQMNRYREVRREVTSVFKVERSGSLASFLADVYRNTKFIRIIADAETRDGTPTVLDTILSKSKFYVNVELDPITDVP